MSWAEVKHALNSTVGTSDFESLDEIFKGNWRFISSNIVYKTAPASYTSSGGEYTIGNTFTSKANGVVKFRLSDVETTSTNFTFYVYRNGSTIPAASGTNTNPTSSAYRDYFADCEVNKGDVFTFAIKRSGAGTISSMGNISILCSPIYAPDLFETGVR